MDNIPEYLDAPVVYEAPSDMRGALVSKSIKDRLAALNYLVEEIENGQEETCMEFADLSELLIKETNEAALSKSLEVVEVILKNNGASALQLLPFALEHAGSIKEEIRDFVKLLLQKAYEENQTQSLEIMMSFSSHKEIKELVEISNLLSQILGANIEEIEELKYALPYLQNANGEVKKPVVDLCISLGTKFPKNEIIEFLRQNKIEDEVIESLEEQMVSSENNSVEDNGLGPNDPFDSAKGEKYILPKGFEETIKGNKWKEKKEMLEECIDSILKVDKIEFNDLPKIINLFKVLIQEERTVQVVQLSMKLLALISIKNGTLGNYKEIEQLLQLVQNRTKEKKFAIVNGYEIFIQSILVRANNFSQIENELFEIAIPHKNIEVKEELLRLIKVVCATHIIYSVNDKSNKEDEQINILSNDFFPTPIFPSTEEVMPESGEKSYGMELNERVWRQYAGKNMTFVQYYVGNTPNVDKIMFVPEEYASFFDNIDKLLNDINNNVRELAYRAISLFLVSNILEGCNAISASNENENILNVYNEMYEYFISFINESKRRNEILIILQQIINFIELPAPFYNLLNQNNFSQEPSFEQEETVEVNKQMQMEKMASAVSMFKNNEEPQALNEVRMQKPASKLFQEQKPEQEQKFSKTQLSYEERMVQSDIIVNPNDSSSPLTSQMLEQLHNYLGYFVSEPSFFFVKDVIKAPFGCQGSLRWITENIDELFNCELHQYRDIILIYLSLLISDGFLVKSQASPIHIKLFMEKFFLFSEKIQEEEIQLNKYDLQCILPVILMKLEEQSTNTAKQSLFKAFELLLQLSESLEDFILICLETISKSNKILIRQIVTKVSILRLIAGLCTTYEEQEMKFTSLLPIHLSGLEEFYTSKQAENYVLTESAITKLIPSNVTSVKQLTIYIANILINCSSYEIQDRIIQYCKKFMVPADIRIQSGEATEPPELSEQQCKPNELNNVSLRDNCHVMQEEQFVSDAKVPEIIQEKQDFNQEFIKSEVNYHEHPFKANEFSSEASFERRIQAEYHDEQEIYEQSVAENIDNANDQNRNANMQTPELKQHKNRFARNQERPVEEELEDFPETLVEVPDYPSPLPLYQTKRIFETPNLQDIMEEQENQEYEYLIDIVPKQMDASERLLLIKQFVRELRTEESNIYLESEVEKLALKILEIVEFINTPAQLEQQPSGEFIYTVKYAILALSELSNAEMFHQSHIYKKTLQILIPAVAIISLYNLPERPLLLGIFEGYVLQMADICDIFRLSTSIIELLVEIVQKSSEYICLNIISQNDASELYQFVYLFLLSYLERLQPQLVYDLQQEINKRVSIAESLSQNQNIVGLEPQLREEMMSYWNGADEFMFQLHLITISGQFQFVDEILRSLSDEVVYLMGKVPDCSAIKERLHW